RIAVVADSDLSPQAAELLLVEDLGDEPEVAESGQPAVLGNGDPGRLLPAVLKREEAEVRQARHVAIWRMDAEDAAQAERPSRIGTKRRERGRFTRARRQARIAAPRLES